MSSTSSISKISVILIFLLCTLALSVCAVQLRPVGRGKLAIYVGTGDCDHRNTDDLVKKARSALRSVSSFGASRRPDGVSVLWAGGNTCLFVGSTKGYGNVDPRMKKVLEVVAADPSETRDITVVTTADKNARVEGRKFNKSTLTRRAALDKPSKNFLSTGLYSGWRTPTFINTQFNVLYTTLSHEKPFTNTVQNANYAPPKQSNHQKPFDGNHIETMHVGEAKAVGVASTAREFLRKHYLS